jgi:hypothetical protein
MQSESIQSSLQSSRLVTQSASWKVFGSAFIGVPRLKLSAFADVSFRKDDPPQQWLRVMNSVTRGWRKARSSDVRMRHGERSAFTHISQARRDVSHLRGRSRTIGVIRTTFLVPLGSRGKTLC